MLYIPAPFQRPDPGIINPLSDESLDARIARNIAYTPTTVQTWVANLAVFIPFGISQPFLVREVSWYNGSTGGSNIDVGVYDTAGNRKFSLGSTAQGTVSVIVTSATLPDFTLDPGDYYMAFACDGTTSRITGGAPTAVLAAGVGVGQMTSAFPLPDPATIVPLTNALVPLFGLNGYTVAP